MEFLPVGLRALSNFKQFVVYEITSSNTRPGKTDKIPVDVKTGNKLKWSDKNTWLTAQQAIESARTKPSLGVGFIFTINDPFWFLDIDSCTTLDGKDWTPLAYSLCNAFTGAYVEVSSSNRGLHIIGSGTAHDHVCKNISHNLELYTSERFVALTGTNAAGDARLDCSAKLSWLVNEYFSVKQTNNNSVTQDWSNEPVAEWCGSNDDDELIETMFKSKSAANSFGGKITFEQLWNKDVDALRASYPADRDCGYDESKADACLAQRLAFWTGNNCQRIKTLMLRSGLVREKYAREDYLPRTIKSACGKQKEWSKKTSSSIQSHTSVTENQTESIQIGGNKYLNIEDQIKFFSGCVYVMDAHKILIPSGYMLDPQRFRVMYGGNSFPMDLENNKVKQDAWLAFTESQAISHPKVESSTFRPDLAPGIIITRDQRRLVNIYHPVITDRMQGDPTLFLNHIALLFGTGRDALIIKSYMSALIQYKGIKFQWCPLIQGIEGNGKTLLTRIVAFAIGDRYTHFPKAQEIAGKFNAWMDQKIFIAVEDIYDGSREIVEALKPMVTNNRQEIEPKGGEKVTKDICCNFIINTNHKDGLRKHRTDRRFAPFYTLQQQDGDLQRDGLTHEYFSFIWTWLHNGGFAICHEYLATFDIPIEFDPTKQVSTRSDYKFHGTSDHRES